MDLKSNVAFTLCFVGIASVICSFVPVTREPGLSQVYANWVFKYDQFTGIIAMRKAYKPKPNDTCHVFKLTDQQRHDIHIPIQELRVQTMMYDAIATKHGEKMTKSELNSTSRVCYAFCKVEQTLLKYNFYA